MGPEEVKLIIEALATAGPEVLPLLWFIVLQPYFEMLLMAAAPLIVVWYVFKKAGE